MKNIVVIEIIKIHYCDDDDEVAILVKIVHMNYYKNLLLVKKIILSHY